VVDLRFIDGANTFEVVPNFSLRALIELHVEFDAVPAAERVDPETVAVA
jgi:hypothetical protein